MYPLLGRFSFGDLGVALGLREPFVLRNASVLLALACLVVWMGTLRGARRLGLGREEVSWVVAVGAVSAFLGARASYLVFNETPFFSILLGIVRWGEGGLSGVGALAFGLLAARWASRRFGQPFFPLFDQAAPCLAFAIVAVRIGCYLQGCDFGRPLGAGSPEWVVRLGTFPHHDLPAHPTQLYEAFLGIALLAGSLWFARRVPFHGALGLAVVGTYALGSAALARFHADPERGSSSFALLVVGCTCGAIAWMKMREQAALDVEAHS